MTALPLTPPAGEPEVPLSGALAIIRRGLRESPELRRGLTATLALAVFTAVGRVLVPVLVQQVLDRGLRARGGFNAGLTYGLCVGAALVVGLVYLGARARYRRMVVNSEAALAGLRVRAFEHIHRLSIAEQTAQKRGALTGRVTSDIDALADFLEWGALTWVIGPVLMLGCVVAMFTYSWQLTLLVLGCMAPMSLVLRAMQRGMMGAYDRMRGRVGEALTEVSESLQGAAVVRAYGLEERTERRLRSSIDRQYHAEIYAQRFSATIFPIADLFGALAVAGSIALGAVYGRSWGLSLGGVVAFLFLVNLFMQPATELSETFEQAQIAIAAWRKVFGLLDLPVEIPEHAEAESLPRGPLEVRVEGVGFAYREGGQVLHDLTLTIPRGAHVAVVGETGSGKSTFTRLLCRLADPTAGRVLVEGIDLRRVGIGARRRALRLVPQDGFLFDTTIADNVRRGDPDADDAAVAAAFAALGLEEWLAGVPGGLNAPVGERGENLSVGERQLVALARAQVADPGLLILDEATSSVDPETERVISLALARLSAGRTTVTVAHRLSTAETADSVLVFDRGALVERGDHSSLVAAGGVYAGLYESWLGNTREAEAASLVPGG
ncbi:MAG: ABC transporter ATP-binding protein [Candidatus Dormibacteria bacterium]